MMTGMPLRSASSLVERCFSEFTHWRASSPPLLLLWSRRVRKSWEEPPYSSRLFLLRLHTIPVCSFELNPNFS